MLMRFFPCLATFCLIALPSAARPAEEKAVTPPTLVVKVQSIDNLRDNIKYLGQLVATLRIDQIPDFLKQIGLTQFELQLADAKEQKPKNETPAQQTFREQTIDTFFAQVASVIRDGGELGFQLDVDRATNDLA